MILITGYTGNTGSLVLQQLLKTHNPADIVGVTRKVEDNSNTGINVFEADLSDAHAIQPLFEKYDIKSIIHIANIKYSPLLLEIANKYKVNKVVLIHTTGVYSKYRSYSSLYETIEKEILNNSYPNTNYIILRPTMIYGNHRDHNMHKLIKFLNMSPIFPIFGDGSSLMQPVHVQDLANATIAAFQSESIFNEDFDLSGGSVETYNSVLEIISIELKKKVRFVHVPINLAIFGAKISSKILPKPIVSVEQVERLQENKAYSNQKARDLLGYNPRTFKEGIFEEINLLKLRGMIK